MKDLLEGHRLANYFPSIEGDAFKELVDDIRKNGQLSPIVLYEGKILDGKNRYRACQTLGITPITREYDGDDPLSFVISSNILRRHLDDGQRAMLALEMLPEFEAKARERLSEKAKKQQDGTKGFKPVQRVTSVDVKRKHKPQSVDDAGKQFDISGATVQRAKRIRKAVDDGELEEAIIEDIKKGHKTIGEVDRVLHDKRFVKKAKEEKHKLPNEYPQVVKDHIDFLKDMKTKLKEETYLVVQLKDEGMFSPEAIQFITNIHGQMVSMFKEMENDEENE